MARRLALMRPPQLPSATATVSPRSVSLAATRWARAGSSTRCRLVDALDDERDVVACRGADQLVDQPVRDILDGFIAQRECRIGEAKQTDVEGFVASLDEA